MRLALAATRGGLVDLSCMASVVAVVGNPKLLNEQKVGKFREKRAAANSTEDQEELKQHA